MYQAIVVFHTQKYLWYDDLWNEYLRDRLMFVFSPDVILCC